MGKSNSKITHSKDDQEFHFKRRTSTFFRLRKKKHAKIIQVLPAKPRMFGICSEAKEAKDPFAIVRAPPDDSNGSSFKRQPVFFDSWYETIAENKIQFKADVHYSSSVLIKVTEYSHQRSLVCKSQTRSLTTLDSFHDSFETWNVEKSVTQTTAITCRQAFNKVEDACVIDEKFVNAAMVSAASLALPNLHAMTVYFEDTSEATVSSFSHTSQCFESKLASSAVREILYGVIDHAMFIAECTANDDLAEEKDVANATHLDVSDLKSMLKLEVDSTDPELALKTVEDHKGASVHLTSELNCLDAEKDLTSVTSDFGINDTGIMRTSNSGLSLSLEDANHGVVNEFSSPHSRTGATIDFALTSLDPVAKGFVEFLEYLEQNKLRTNVDYVAVGDTLVKVPAMNQE